jgi:DNA modification methylase
MTPVHIPNEIEFRPIDALIPYAGNARTHSEEQIEQLVRSIQRFRFTNPVLIGKDGTIIAGHARVIAARKLGMAEVPCIVLDHLSEAEQRALVLADNKLALSAGWDDAMLRAELQALQDEDFDLDVVGFNDEELRALLADPASDDQAAEQASAEDSTPEAPADPVTRAGDIWVIGPHRLICGDCRELAVVKAVLNGAAVNVAITSPPYASQREYDSSSGFKPIPPDQYVDWFRAVANNVQAVLAADGSWFVNIKAHAEDGERSLYVMDLVIAHKRQWGWRFVDDLCWRKTDNGVPGGWPNRFKNAWEPVFHFTRQSQIKFRPKAVGHASEDCFDYSPDNPKSTSGSGLLGTGARGGAAGESGSTDEDGRHSGIARPSNVIECKTESTQGSHSAPFPRALVEFFVKAFSDPGDAILDPFTGSGTTLAAAHVLGRAGYGCEISPAYCDVILRRIAELAGVEPVLAATGQTMAEAAAERGVPFEQANQSAAA